MMSMTASSMLSRLEVELDSLERVSEVHVDNPQQQQGQGATQYAHVIYAVTTKV